MTAELQITEVLLAWLGDIKGLLGVGGVASDVRRELPEQEDK
jgi:hypothetical protein